MIDLDELERLEREATDSYIGYKKDGKQGSSKCVTSEEFAHYQELRNAARELIADAKRYRWLLNEIDRPDVPPLGRVVWKLKNDRKSHLWCDFAMSQEVSAAIDAAIAKEKQ